jgi:hypothetical protein
MPDHTGPRRGAPAPARFRRPAPLALAAAVGATAMAVAVSAGGDRPGRVPQAAAEPVPTSTAPTPSSGDAAYPSDALGYLDSAARCDDAQVLTAYGRTSRSLVVVCLDPTGQMQYRGVRLSDGATLSMPAGRASDGAIVATNAGVTYALSPAAFLVSEGDSVLYRDNWVEFREPGFTEAPDATTGTSTAAATITAPSTPAAPDATTTVPTTTVTLAPGES